MTDRVLPRIFGSRFWCGTVIGLCGVVLVLSAAGIIGAWVAARTLGDAAIAALDVVEQGATTVRPVLQRVDAPLAQMHAISTGIAGATAQLGQNVTDKGLILTLLPEEREQRLVELGGTVQDVVGGARDTLGAAMDLYRAIDRLPFVRLPQPVQEAAAALESSAAETRAATEQLRQNIRDFRAGAADRIGRVEAGANQLTQILDVQRQRIASLDANMVALQELAVGLRGRVRPSLTLIAILVSLLLAFNLFTQVEVMRLYLGRWRQLRERS